MSARCFTSLFERLRDISFSFLLFENRVDKVRQSILASSGLDGSTVDWIIQHDHSPAKVNSAWVARVSQSDGKSLDDSMGVANAYYDLHARKKIRDPQIPRASSYMDAVKAVRQADPDRAARADEVSQATGQDANAERIYEDDRFIVVEPEDHAASCYYGKDANKVLCIATPKTDKYWAMAKDPRAQGLKIYYIINKLAAKKNPFSIVTLGVYPPNMVAHIRNMDTTQLVDQAKRNYAQLEAGWAADEQRQERPFNMSDEDLASYLESTLKPLGIEIFDSYNERVNVNDLSSQGSFPKSLLSKLINPERDH